MLERLFIKNFALIEEITIEFSENFNILTGETGAGKSIVVDAVSLLLGGRAQADYIRTGSNKSIIEGSFSLEATHGVFAILSEIGIECEDSTIVLSREISLTGRNSCRINGRVLTLGQYRQVGLSIIDIHGQHDHQSLLMAEKHLDLLDKFGGQEQVQLLAEVKTNYNTWRAAQSELKELNSREQERLQQMDFLTYQATEIQEAQLTPGEDVELKRQADLMINAEKISNNLHNAYQNLFGQEKGMSAYDLLGIALDSINEIKKLDPSLDKMAEQLEPSLYIIEEMATECRNYLETLDFSARDLEQVEKRLQQIKDLCKKYGPTIEEVLAFGEKAQGQLEKWENTSERIQQLERITAESLDIYRNGAEKLSKKRRDLALILEEKVSRELKELAMPDALFSVAITKSEPGSRGMDQIEFLISPNPGEPLLPVAKIASGGELSRIMLALKTITADLDEIGTMIFDEIDSGVGGKAAQKVAEKLECISRSQQVICVTHSPLVAALADHHLLLEKVVLEGRTKTLVRFLTRDEKVNELARMLGGETQTDDLKRHALKILKK